MSPVNTAARCLAIAFLGLLPLAGCSKGEPDLQPTRSTDPQLLGDSQAGRTLIENVGCGSCHVIPGILAGDGLVGPPLDHIASRQYLAGLLHNTPDNMVTWLRFPQRIVPGNAMPDLGLSEHDARDIAAYLYTLK